MEEDTIPLNTFYEANITLIPKSGKDNTHTHTHTHMNYKAISLTNTGAKKC